MKQVPLTLVIALVAIGTAQWPGVAAWSEVSVWHHALVHGLYLLGGGAIGIQIAIWARAAESEAWNAAEENEVTS